MMWIRSSLVACWMGLCAVACGSNPELIVPPQTFDGGGGEGGEAAIDMGPDLTLGGNKGEGGNDSGIDMGPQCGDLVVDADELCDDGNNDPGDGCNSACQVEDGFSCDELGTTCYECGNSILEGSEECD